MRRSHKLVISAILGLVVSIASLALPVRLDGPNEMYLLEFGRPLAFVVQDQSRYDPPLSLFPMNFHFVSPWETPTQVFWWRFVASFLVVSCAIYVLIVFIPRKAQMCARSIKLIA